MEKTLNCIDKILAGIRTHPEYSHFIKEEYLKSLFQEADKHSLSIEKENCISPSKEKKRCYESLSEARMFLAKEGVTLSSLSQLGGIIQPFDEHEKANPQRFRIFQVKFGDFYGAPPESIHQSVDNLVHFLNYSSNVHSVLRASAVHLETVRIHPYIDGNGRAARLLQNFCLEQRDYPPAVISSSERDHYFSLISNVFGNKSLPLMSISKPSASENLFYTFVASKVLSSARGLEEELKSKRLYDISLKGLKKKGVAISVSNALKGAFKRRGKQLAVSLDYEPKEALFHVRGDISKDELNCFFGKYKGRDNISYFIKPLV